MYGATWRERNFVYYMLLRNIVGVIARVLETLGYSGRLGTRDARVLGALGALGALGYSGRSGTRGARLLETLGCSGRLCTQGARVLGAFGYAGRLHWLKSVRLKFRLAMVMNLATSPFSSIAVENVWCATKGASEIAAESSRLWTLWNGVGKHFRT